MLWRQEALIEIIAVYFLKQSDWNDTKSTKNSLFFIGVDTNEKHSQKIQVIEEIV